MAAPSMAMAFPSPANAEKERSWHLWLSSISIGCRIHGVSLPPDLNPNRTRRQIRSLPVVRDAQMLLAGGQGRDGGEWVDRERPLVALVEQWKLAEAREFSRVMDVNGVLVSLRSYEKLFRLCANSKLLYFGMFVHSKLRRDVKLVSGTVAVGLLRMYLCCGCVEGAENLVNEVDVKEGDTLTKMANLYVQNGMLVPAVLLLLKMCFMSGLELSHSVCVRVIRAVAGSLNVELGKQLHAVLVKTGMWSRSLISVALVGMYIRLGLLEVAQIVCDCVGNRNVVAFTELMVGHNQVEKHGEALALFDQVMHDGIQLDEFAFQLLLRHVQSWKTLMPGDKFMVMLLNLGWIRVSLQEHHWLISKENVVG